MLSSGLSKVLPENVSNSMAQGPSDHNPILRAEELMGRKQMSGDWADVWSTSQGMRTACLDMWSAAIFLSIPNVDAHAGRSRTALAAAVTVGTRRTCTKLPRKPVKLCQPC